MEEIKKCIEEVSHFLDATMGATNREGLIFAATDESLVGNQDSSVKAFVMSSDNKTVAGGNTYIKLNHDQKLVAVAFIKGTDVVSANYLELLAGWIGSALKEKNTEEESEGFLKNVLLENELPGDIPLKAREYRIPYTHPRQALLINFKENFDLQVKSALNSILESEQEHHVLPMDEKNLVILLDLGKHSALFEQSSDVALDEKKCQEQMDEIEDFPNKIYDALNESIEKLELHIGVGMPTETLKDISRSYREASLALTVGKIFESDRKSCVTIN